MNKRHLLLLFIGLATFSFSQKITIEEGDFSFLKEVTKLNVTYDYSEMGVGKFKTEKEYTDKKVSEKNKSKTRIAEHSSVEPSPFLVRPGRKLKFT